MKNDAGILPLSNRIVASLGREDLFNKVLDFEDGTFEYELYELNLDERYEMPERGPSGHQIEEEVIFGESIRYVGDSISNTQMAGNRIAFAYLWEVIAPPQGNYLVRVELLNIDDNEIYRTWQTTIAPTEDAYYNTELWEVNELIVDNHSIMLDYSDMPRGTNIYRFVVNFVDAETGETIPMTIDGEAAEGYIMSSPLSIGQ